MKWLVAGGLTAFGLIFVWAGCSIQSKARAAETWPTVEGTVLESKVVEREEREKGRTRIMYSAEVLYSYVVNGKTYKSTKISHTEDSSSLASPAEETARRYRTGKGVTVHYNPDDPSEALLEPEAGSSPVFFVGFGVLAMIAGIGSGVWIARQPRRAAVRPPPRPISTARPSPRFRFASTRKPAVRRL